MHFHDAGRGAPVLLLHGCGGLGEEILRPFLRARGLRLIAPDRLSYGYSNTIGHAQDADPRAQALTMLRLLDWLGIDQCTVVAHSLASPVALWLAANHPSRVKSLVLLAPFCRPTPEAAMPLLRLAVAPVIGAPIRHIAIPPLSGWLGRRQIRGLLHPQPVPPWLKRFPCRHAASPNALLAAAAELRCFNKAMSRFRPVHDEVPSVTIFGDADRTADASWHGEWLARHLPQMRFVHLPLTGHAPHHSEPALVAGIVRRMATDPHQISGGRVIISQKIAATEPKAGKPKANQSQNSL
jgi:pimeloyl-ACP methyl ester carboxylesterase